MRRWLAVAALGAVFFPLPAWGQRHGGGSAGFAGRGGGFSHGPMVSGRGPMISPRGVGTHGTRGGNFPGFVPSRGPTITNGPFSPFGFHHHHHFPSGFNGWPWWGWGYGGWDWGWGLGWDGSNDYASQQYYPTYDNSGAYYAQSAMQAQQSEINQLEDEVNRLQAERDRAAEQPRPSAQTRSKAEPQPTELIFKDKHTEQVQNYAIVGQTFWIFNEQHARKIALAELDLPATQKANEDRGVDFDLPR